MQATPLSLQAMPEQPIDVSKSANAYETMSASYHGEGLAGAGDDALDRGKKFVEE
jgi:hypothetical protein